jgi:hypothetical protein
MRFELTVKILILSFLNETVDVSRLSNVYAITLVMLTDTKAVQDNTKQRTFAARKVLQMFQGISHLKGNGKSGERT